MFMLYVITIANSDRLQSLFVWFISAYFDYDFDNISCSYKYTLV